MRLLKTAIPLSVVMSLAILSATSLARGAETVSYPSGAETLKGFLALPSANAPAKQPGKRPAVILIHEWWGLNDWVKTKARSFADEGYVALAVDLYRGQVAADADAAHQLMRGLPEDRALRDLQAAMRYLSSRPDVDGHIGVVGWCMGGGYSLSLAVAEPKLSAAVIYYGRLLTDPVQIAKIKAPLLGNFGATDQGIPAASVTEFASQAQKAGVHTSFKVYPVAGHGFASSKDPKVFRADDAKDADARTNSFFLQYLVGLKK